MLVQTVHYAKKVRDLEITLLMFETAIAVYRTFMNASISALYLLTIIQPLLLYVIINRRHNREQCQIFIILAVVLIYFNIHDELYYIVQKQHTIIDFIKRCYWLQVMYRIFSINVQWKRWCAYKIMRETNILRHPDQQYETGELVSFDVI